VFVFVLFGGYGQHDPYARLHNVGAYLLFPLVGLIISHAVSYVANFLGRKEYLWVSPEELMRRPYGRIVALHLTIIFGGMLVMKTGTLVGGLIVLIGIKTIADLLAHWRERGLFSGGTTGAGE
jgi:hypothetical protein